MAKYDLRAMIRRSNPGMRRKAIVLRDIVPPANLAGDLFRACYLPVVQVWERAAPRIVDEYERTLSSMTTDSPADVQAQIDGAAGEFDRIFLLLQAELRDWTLRTERWQRGKWRGAILSATGVDVGTMIGPEDVRATIGNTIEWNIALIKDVSAEAQKRISNSVFSGLNERKPAREVAKEIREATGMARRRSVAIASDQLSKISNALADERRREAGLSKWKWRSSHKKNFRPEHQARDGKVYTDETAPADKPGQLPYCGCRPQAIIDLD